VKAEAGDTEANIRPREAGEGDRAERGGGASASKHLCRHSNDRVSRFINTARQFASGNAHHRHAMRLKPSIAAGVALRPIAHVVTDSINLDREPRLRSKEIEHIWPDWMLATKHRLSRHALAQSIP
jgi:hypothetical protein